MQRIIFFQLLLAYLVICDISYEDNNNNLIEKIEDIILANKFRKIVLIKSIGSDAVSLQKIPNFTHFNYFPTILVDIEDVKSFNGKYHEKFSYEATQEESKIYIILVGNMNDFPKILNETMKLFIWRNRDRVIVKFENGSNEEMQILFKLCWEKRVLNIIFVLSNFIYTYNPYFDNYNIVLNSKNVFFDKYDDLNGYTIKFSRFLTPLDMLMFKKRAIGRDAFLAKTLAYALNASYEFFSPRDGITYGLKFPNGTMTGVFNDVATRYTDIAINSRLVKLQFENILEHTYPHDREDLGCLVPKSQNQPEYKKFTILFPQTMWILVGLSMLLYTIIWHFAVEIKNRELPKAILNVFAVTLGYPIADQHGWKLRAIMISYRVYIFLLLAAYSAVLTSVLTVPIQLPEINSLAELDTSGLKIIAAARFKDMLIDNVGSTLTPSLVNRITTVPDDPDIERVIKDRGHYAIILKETFALRAVLEKDNFKNGEEIYRIMTEKPMPSQVCYALRFGSAALPRINHLLRIFQESGLNEHWKHSTIHLLTVSKSMGEKEEGHGDVEKIRVLTLGNVSAAYYVLAIGLSVSSVIFVGEIVWFGIKRKKIKKKKSEIVR